MSAQINLLADLEEAWDDLLALIYPPAMTSQPPGPLAAFVLNTPALTTVTAGSSVTFTGQGVDKNGKATAASGVPIYVFSDEVLASPTPATTTAPDGSFRFSLTFPADGTYTIQVASTPTGI